MSFVLSCFINNTPFWINRSVSEFISFIKSEASDRYPQKKRKTINGEDILLATSTLGFDSYVEPLRTFLTKVRDASKHDRTMTMGGELTNDLCIQVAQAQANQTGESMVQAQVGATVQVQTQSVTAASTSLSAPKLTTKSNVTAANPNGVEPYGYSVRSRDAYIYVCFNHVCCFFSFVGSCSNLYSKWSSG